MSLTKIRTSLSTLPVTLYKLTILAWRRIRYQPLLTLLALFGIILSVALLSSSAFFSQAVDRVLLDQELAVLSNSTGREPFSSRLYFLPSTRSPLSLENAENIGNDVADTFSSEINLPIDHQSIQVESKGMLLLPSADNNKYEVSKNKPFLTTFNFVYISAVAEQLTVVAGEPFDNEGQSGGGVLDVWMHRDQAAEMGIEPGESFNYAVNVSQPAYQLIVRGLWQSADPTDRFWFSNPDTNLNSSLLLRRQDYIDHVQPLLPSKIGWVAWHIILDDSRLNPAYASSYVTGFEKGLYVINQYVPGVKLDLSALTPLTKFTQRQSALTRILLAFNIPALGFLLAFLALVSLIIAEWQRRDTAILISRGLGLPIILGLLLVEQALLIALGIPLGMGLGMAVARVMGNTVSFLTFAPRADFPVSLQGANPWLIALAVGIALAARLIPAALAATSSVLQQERERARPIRPPLWQRTYADLLLILPTWYLIDQLRKQGSFSPAMDPTVDPNAAIGEVDALLQDPLMILLPTLFTLTAALLSMRLFPLLMRLLDVVAARTPWLTLHLTLRQLSRQSQGYVNPLLLVVLSLALGIYTMSLAASFDQWLVDRVYYQVGADATFEPAPFPNRPGLATSGAGESFGAGWIPPPNDFMQLPGVVNVGRMGRYNAEIPTIAGGRPVRGNFMGIDRIDFPHAAWYRNDFAHESLGAMMNRLATEPENILVSRRYFEQTQRQSNEMLQLKVSLEPGVSITADFRIVGVYERFPTVEGERETIIGNLDYLFFLGNGEFLHSIWLRTNESLARTPANSGVDAEAAGQLFKSVEQLGFVATKRQSAGVAILEEQSKFERVGIFGTLSVGFIAAALMAILALLVYSSASLKERLYQFGIMRALGVNHGQVVLQIVLEYAFIIAYGTFAGIWIGLIAALLFVPFFRIAPNAGDQLLPILPIIAQDQILPLATLFALVMIGVIALLILHSLRGRLFDALRIGHQG